MSLQKIRLGGVPEHFNLPIHLAIEDGHFTNAGIELEWVECAGGTGQMTAALRNHEADVCILLTEGIIKDIIDGNPSQIISGYVNTPLIWGIHTGAANQIRHHADVYDRQYAISRFGSGSHLMAIVDATSQNFHLDKKQFTPVKHLKGALESLEALETDVFYWEKFTTKPYVDSGQLRRIGEFVTPWPCFVIAATNQVLTSAPSAIHRMLRIIHQSSADFMESAEAISKVAKRYALDVADVARWYHATEWATHGWVSDKMLQSVVYNLEAADLLPLDTSIPPLVWKRP